MFARPALAKYNLQKEECYFLVLDQSEDSAAAETLLGKQRKEELSQGGRREQ